jgi:hypothetical protein
MKGAAIAVCNMIRDAKSADQVRFIVNNADGLSAKFENDLAAFNLQLATANVRAAAAQQQLLDLEALLTKLGIDPNDPKIVAEWRRHPIVSDEYATALETETKLQVRADEAANMLTALTFAGPAINGCAEAKIARLEQQPTPSQQAPAASPVTATPPEPAPPAADLPTGPVCNQAAYDTARKAYEAAVHAKYRTGAVLGAESIWVDQNDPVTDTAAFGPAFVNGAKTGDYGTLCDLYRRGAAIYNAHVVAPEPAL